MTNILTQLVNLILGNLTRLKVQIIFFPQKIIQTLFQSINCQHDHKNKNSGKGKYFSQKKKIVVVINNTLICKYYIIKFIVTLASLAQ